MEVPTERDLKLFQQFESDFPATDSVVRQLRNNFFGKQWKKSSITRRWVKNDRLNHAGYLWAFATPTASPGAKAHYKRRRETGDCTPLPRGTSSTR